MCVWDGLLSTMGVMVCVCVCVCVCAEHRGGDVDRILRDNSHGLPQTAEGKVCNVDPIHEDAALVAPKHPKQSQQQARLAGSCAQHTTTCQPVRTAPSTPTCQPVQRVQDTPPRAEQNRRRPHACNVQVEQFAALRILCSKPCALLGFGDGAAWARSWIGEPEPRSILQAWRVCARVAVCGRVWHGR